MRLYHSAIEMMYSEPEFAYLFLVMSVEAIASAVYADLKPSNEGEGRTELDQYLDSDFPGWREYCNISTPEERKRVTNMLLNRAYFTRRKFRKFVNENLPEVFWSETEDDAKPGGYGSDKSIHEWEKIDKAALKNTLNSIYSARSKLVHEGVRFPASIVMGHFRLLPSYALPEILEAGLTGVDGQEASLRVPPLLTFERLASRSLIEFLRKQGASPVE
jgi:hypothetical protein